MNNQSRCNYKMVLEELLAPAGSPEVLTIAGKEFTAAKKYQYIFATYPDLAASSANVLLIDGKKAEFTVVPVGK